jgi:5-bromo-4-chloroindolyl phosphate hydrolysis protein
LVKKRQYLSKYSQYLSEINNTSILSDTLLAASRNLEMSRQLSATTVTLGELLKSMPKDAEGIMETLREQTSEVHHYSKIQSTPLDLNEEESVIEDELEVLLNEQYPSVPITTGKEKEKNKVEQVGLLL